MRATERNDERAELRMAVGAGVRKLTSRSHLEAESIGGTCTSQEGDEREERERSGEEREL